MRAHIDIDNVEFLDTSIMSDDDAIDHVLSMAAMSKGRDVCSCEFFTRPDGPVPNAVQHEDGSVWCGDCGGWMLDDN